MASSGSIDAPNSWCRVCLEIDVRMHWVRNTRLLEVYQKLTSTKLNAEDGRPHTICYICYSQLQRCWRFSDMCHKSEQIQRELLLRGTERIPPRVTSNLSSYLQYNLSYPEVLDVKAEFVGVVKSDPEEHCERQFASALDVGLFGTTDTAEAPTAVTHNLAETALPFLSIIDYSNHTEGQVKEEPIDIEENTLVEDITVNDKIISSELLPVKVKSESNNVCALSFCCDVCNQTFAMNRKPAQHMLINFNKEQHACNMCNKTFTTGSNLNRHRRIHTGEKPYACSICNKSFRCSSELIKHKINHTGKKPYACNLCNKSFSHGKILETLLPDPNEVNRRNVLKVKHELTKIEKTRARIKKVGSVLKETTEVARKECKGCKAQKKRVQTIYECKHCEGSPGFCTKCFCLAHS